MENKIATFDNTVAILMKAYLDGTLLKGDCRACAVGNLCAAAQGTSVYLEKPAADYESRRGRWLDGSMPEWDNLFVSARGEQIKRWLQDDFKPAFYPGAFAQVEATGYTVEQLARVEYAFETAGPGYNEEAEYAGLMAVVDVLADIHGIDLTSATAAKALFVRAA